MGLETAKAALLRMKARGETALLEAYKRNAKGERLALYEELFSTKSKKEK